MKPIDPVNRIRNSNTLRKHKTKEVLLNKTNLWTAALDVTLHIGTNNSQKIAPNKLLDNIRVLKSSNCKL